MRRFLTLLLIAAVILLVILFISNPSLLDEIWLWLIGFAGSIFGFIANIFEQLKYPSKEENPPISQKPDNTDTVTEVALSKSKLEALKKEIQEKEELLKHTTPFLGTTISLIRFTHDQDTTLGLFYINGKFMAYTLEDTFRETKVKGKTRIPAGTYRVDFRDVSNPPSKLTADYRKRSDLKGFFTHHLEIKDIENFDKVYIHIGNKHQDTAGCILIADGIYDDTVQKKILKSVRAFTKIYKRLQALLEGGENVRIVIYDEDWIENLNTEPVNT